MPEELVTVSRGRVTMGIKINAQKVSSSFTHTFLAQSISFEGAFFPECEKKQTTHFG